MSARVLGVVLCVAALAATGAAGQGVAIRGTVVDQGGKPIEGASVSTLWLEGSPRGGVTTDAEGRFRLEADARGRPLAVLVMDEGRKRGVLSRYPPGSYDEERRLELKRLVKVQGKFSCTGLGERPSWTNVYVNVMPERTRVARCSSDEAEFSFLLPPGEYELYMYGTDVEKTTIQRSVEGNEGVIDLGTVDLDPTELAKLYGKKPPRWTVTDARGVDKKVQLADYKGRYVLLEFWGFW